MRIHFGRATERRPINDDTDRSVLNGGGRAGAPVATPATSVVGRVVRWAAGLGAEVARPRHLGVTILIAAYFFWFVSQSLKVYYGYGFPPFDLGIFDQGIWLLSHFHAPFVTVMGRNLFGDHTSFVLVFVAVLYRLFPEPQGILVLQTLVIATAAVPIYLLAQKFTKNTLISTALVATYLLNPALQQGNLEQFHPEAFQVLFITLAIYAALEAKPAMLAVTVALALLVKEDAAVLIVPLGVWVGVRRNWKWGYRIITAAVGYALFANLVVIRGILGTNSFYSGRVPFGGVSGFLGTLLRRPAQVWTYLQADGRPYYLWQMGLSSGWGFLLAPEIAAIALLALLENTLSNDPYMHQILYHYSMPIVPVLVLGTVYAVARQTSQRRRMVVTSLVTAAALWSCVMWGLAPFSVHQVQPGWDPSSATGRGVAYVMRGVPANAVVSAWYPLVSHLDHRTQIYMWPTPFSASNWGLATREGQRLPVASQVEYLILPDPLDGAQNPDVFARISSQFTLIRHGGGLGLYRKVGP